MKQAVVIGISGGTGSGKTTLANRLKDYFCDEITLICQDYYYKSFDELSFEERRRLNFDHPDAFDNELLVEQLKMLKAFRPVDRPVYSFTEYKRLERTVREQAKHVIIVEGLMIFTVPDLVKLMDIKIFVDTDADIRLIRRLKRDIQERGRSMHSVMEQYLNTVKPMHEAFVEPSKRKADIIIPEGGLNNVAYEMVANKINSILETKNALVTKNT